MDVPQSLQIPGEVVDGGDVTALADCFDRLVSEVRNGTGPRFLEVRCTRWPGNFPLFPELPNGEWQVAWAFDQKPERADLAAWLNQSDPLTLYIRKLVEAGTLDRAQVETSTSVSEKLPPPPPASPSIARIPLPPMPIGTSLPPGSADNEHQLCRGPRKGHL